MSLDLGDAPMIRLGKDSVLHTLVDRSERKRREPYSASRFAAPTAATFRDACAPLAEGRIRLVLPEPPSLNQMLDLSRRRTKRTRDGGFMRKALPVVYDQQKEIYETVCLAFSRSQLIAPPDVAWPKWRLERAEFRLHGLRDVTELLAGLKWPVDWMVKAGFVENDGPTNLLYTPTPEQRIARDDRGITIEISEVQT